MAIHVAAIGGIMTTLPFSVDIYFAGCFVHVYKCDITLMFQASRDVCGQTGVMLHMVNCPLIW